MAAFAAAGIGWVSIKTLLRLLLVEAIVEAKNHLGLLLGPRIQSWKKRVKIRDFG